MTVKELDSIERDLLLAVLLHYMSMDTRYKIMNLLPNVYNKLVESDVMRVTKRVDGIPPMPAP
jgi:hypothetical protein